MDIAHSLEGVPDSVSATAADFPLIKVNLFEKFDGDMYQKVNRAPLDNILSRHVPEVYQTLDYVWIPSTNCINVVFVFHTSKITDGTFPCQGMKHVCAIRYKYDGASATDVVESEEEWIPFPCGLESSVAESYMSRVWTDIAIVQEECRKGLNVRTQTQTLFTIRKRSTINQRTAGTSWRNLLMECHSCLVQESYTNTFHYQPSNGARCESLLTRKS